jgi:hypothetical protein
MISKLHVNEVKSNLSQQRWFKEVGVLDEGMSVSLCIWIVLSFCLSEYYQ